VAYHKGSVRGAKFLAPRYYWPARSVCISPSAFFIISYVHRPLKAYLHQFWLICTLGLQWYTRFLNIVTLCGEFAIQYIASKVQGCHWRETSTETDRLQTWEITHWPNVRSSTDTAESHSIVAEADLLFLVPWAIFPDCAPPPEWRTVGRRFPVNFICFKLYLFNKWIIAPW